MLCSIADQTGVSPQVQETQIDEDEHGYVVPNVQHTYLALHDPDISKAHSKQKELCGSRAVVNNANKVEYENANANFGA